MSGNPRRSDRIRERAHRPQYQESSPESSRQSSPQAPSRASSGSPAFAGRIRHPQQMANAVGSWRLPAASSPFSLPRNPGGSFGVPRNPPGLGFSFPLSPGERVLNLYQGGIDIHMHKARTQGHAVEHPSHRGLQGLSHRVELRNATGLSKT